MGRNKWLNQDEMFEILQLQAKGKNLSQIANKMKRSRCVIRNFLRDQKKYGKKKSPGRPPVLSLREKRAILRQLRILNLLQGKLEHNVV